MRNSYRKGDIDALLGHILSVEERHIARKGNHELDHSLWRLDDYILEEVRHNSLIKKENFPSFTSNNPRTLSRAVMALLAKNSPTVRIDVPTEASEEEEDTISANEYLAYGMLYDADMLRARSDQNKLQWELAWYIAHRGGVLIRPLFEPGKIVTPFRITVYDPYECSWDAHVDGMNFFVRTYEMDLDDVMRAWNFDPLRPPGTHGKDTVKLHEVWWLEFGDEEDEVDADVKPEVWNAVIAGGVWAKEPTQHGEFDHMPIYCIRAGGSPARMGDYGVQSSDWRCDQWESIYTGVRQTIGWLNRAVSLFGLYLRNGAIGPWLYEGSVNKNIQRGLNPFKVVRIKQGERFGPVAPPQMAREAKEFLNYIQQEWQRAGVSEIIFGGLPFTVSGFGMLQLRSAVEILIGNFVQAMEAAYTIIVDEMTSQFVTIGRRRKLWVKGRDKRNAAFIERISPRDIKKRYIIECSLKNALPDDPVAKGNAATLWRNAGAPRKAVYEEIFETQDAAAWDRMFMAEQTEALPPIMMLNAIKALLRQGKKEAAGILMQLLQAQMGQMGNLNQGELQNIQNPPEGISEPAYGPPETAGMGEREGKLGGGGRPRRQGEYE